MELQRYAEDDFWPTETLELDAQVMRELGGPVERDTSLQTRGDPGMTADAATVAPLSGVVKW